MEREKEIETLLRTNIGSKLCWNPDFVSRFQTQIWVRDPEDGLDSKEKIEEKRRKGKEKEMKKKENGEEKYKREREEEEEEVKIVFSF